jgi:glycosyltransferase involved in cell wall biosynthesis
VAIARVPPAVHNAPLRILFICAYLPALGMSGGATRMFHIIRGAGAQHAVSVLCYRDTEEELRYVAELEAICERVEVIERGQSLDDWVRDPLHLVPRSVSLEFGNPRMRRRVAQELSSGRYDIAQFEFLDVAYLLPRRVALPTILTHIEVVSRVMAQRVQAAASPLSKLSLVTQWVRALHFEVAMSKRFTTNVFLTANEAGSITRYAPDVASAISHLGVDCTYFQPMQGRVTPGSMVYVGYFRHVPNVDAVMYFCESVLPRIWATQPNATFTIVGGAVPDNVRSLARDPRIRVMGWVDDYRPYLDAAQLVVAPVISGAGMRTKIIEAWAMGKPVVATPLAVEGCGAIHEQNALIAAGPESIARCVLQVLSDSALGERLGQSARMTAERSYDWGVITREHDRIYRDTLDRFRQSPRSYSAVNADAC